MMKGLLGAFKALFLADPGPEAAIADQNDRSSSPEPELLTILIIDDDVAMVDALRLGLSGGRFKVLTANSGVKGLEVLRFAKQEVRVVLLDFGMPRLDGSQTLEHLRKLSPNSKVIGYTGMAYSELPEEYTAGVDLLLAKPCTSAQLIAAIDKLLA
jgi:CheY-like chemotaxis protein